MLVFRWMFHEVIENRLIPFRRMRKRNKKARLERKAGSWIVTNFFIVIYFQGHKLLRNDATEGYVGGLVLSLLLGEVFFRLQMHESLVHVPWLGSSGLLF